MKKKILHFGNIANNAYLNSKFLRSQQYQSDVISLNYRHIMGQPEWEDADVISHGDDFNPNFDLVDKYKKPKWFYDGSLINIIKKFKEEKKIFKNYKVKDLALDVFFYKFYFLLFYLIGKTIYFFFKLKCKKNFKNFLLLHKYHIDSILLKRVFKHYDYVIFYGISSMYGYLSNISYYCYEHGTIRDFPYQQSLIGSLVYVSYKNCKHLFITNCDAINDAKKIGIDKYSFMPHPINEILPKKNYKKNLNKIIKIIDEKKGIKIFHPSRQHWSKENRNPNLDKGNDIFWEGLGLLKKKGEIFFCISIKWGEHYCKTLELINKLKLEDYVIFIDPLCHLDFVRLLNSVDIVADQFYLGSFGSLAPKALMLKKQVLINYNYDFHSWVFKKHPPFLNCQNSFDVCNHLINYNKLNNKQSHNWYEENHSTSIIIKNFEKVLV